MNRIILCGAALLMSLSLSAAYRSMEFKTSDGSTCHVGVDGMVMTVSEGNLVVTNASAEKLELPLSAVLSMQFADIPSSVAEVVSAVKDAVTAYTLGGTVVGCYASVQEAWGALAPGYYLLKDGRGQTIKIVVGK